MISLPEFRGAVPVPETEHDVVETLLAEVIELWESATGRLWNRRTGYVETIEPQYVPGLDIPLGLWPVETISQVRTLGEGESTWTTLAASDYLKVGTRYVRRLGGPWPRGATIEVTYTGGVSDAAPDVKRALITQANFMRSRFAPEKLITRNTFGPQGGATLEQADLHPFFESAVHRHARRA